MTAHKWKFHGLLLWSYRCIACIRESAFSLLSWKMRRMQFHIL